VAAGSTSVPETIYRGLDIEVHVEEHVHPNRDLVIRVLRVRAAKGREIRLFAYHSFKIEESMYQETAYVESDQSSVIHYKRSYYFELFSDPNFGKAVCGEHTLKGLRGTYVDAEDGVLQGGTISHGAADSVLEWDLKGTGELEVAVRLFLAIGRNAESTRKLRDYVREDDPTRFERESQAFWGTWRARHPPGTMPGLNERARELYQASVLVLRHVSATNGSIIASPDTRSLVVGGTAGTSRRRWMTPDSTTTRSASCGSRPSASARTDPSSIVTSPMGRSGARGIRPRSSRSIRRRPSSRRSGITSGGTPTSTLCSSSGRWSKRPASS
jgi:hypothetical protein